MVLDVQHRTPGNLRAFVQVSLRSVRTGKSSDLRFSSQQKIEVVPMMTTKMEYSYKDGQDFVFTNPETYETVTLPPETSSSVAARSRATAASRCTTPG